jgi:four helix bundle protein
MKNFRTYQLSLAFYKSASTVPLPAHLKDQLKRAASSIVLNLAEGAGRRTNTDQKRFFQIAMGSLRESTAILDIANVTLHDEIADKLGAHLYKLIKSKEGF